MFHDDFSLGVGAIVGSAIFNLLIIPALSAFYSEKLETTRDIVHEDAQFYVISVLVLFVVFALGATYVPGGTNSAAILTPILVSLPLATYLHLPPPAGRQRPRRRRAFGCPAGQRVGSSHGVVARDRGRRRRNRPRRAVARGHLRNADLPVGTDRHRGRHEAA